MDAVTPKQIKEARDIFHALLTKKTKEAEWQKLFAEHPYVITPSLPLRLEPKDIIPMGRPGRTEPDLIFYPRNTAPVSFYGVIELKRPDQRIARIMRKNAAILSCDAQTAIEQANQYIREMPSLLSTTLQGSHLFLGNNQYLFIIMGLSENELIFKPGNEFLRAMIQDKLPGNLQILPYDILLRNFEKLYYHDIHILVPATPQARSVNLRSKPLALSQKNVNKMLQDNNFYDRFRNWTGTGLKHQYEAINNLVVLDYTTNLMWQQSGSEELFEDENRWVKDLNQKVFAGYKDWRLPTLEEAMSMIETKENKDGLFIDPVFDGKQRWIWTCDKAYESGRSYVFWVVLLDVGQCVRDDPMYEYSVRAVRSRQLSAE